jgi:transcriptional regulator with XRE-family HTH domain
MQILERLRQAREARGFDLEALAHRTRLRIHLLEAVERGQFDALPRGVYARAVVRAYAEAVGIDPHRVLTEVAALLPEPEDPIDGLARVRGFERSPQPEAPGPRAQAPAGAEGVPAAPAPHARAWTAPLARAASVAALDTTVLLAFVTLVAAATAGLCGISVLALLDMAAPAVLAQALLVGGLYFVLMGGIGGATLGERIVEPQASRRRFRGTLGEAARRAGHLALREASIVLSAAMPWPPPARAGDRPAERRSRTRLTAEAPAR